MINCERIQSVQFLRVLAGFDPKLRFLISTYPPGMPQIESRNLCFKSYIVRSKATDWIRSRAERGFRSKAEWCESEPQAKS